jgi:hypothetical protein
MAEILILLCVNLARQKGADQIGSYHIFDKNGSGGCRGWTSHAHHPAACWPQARPQDLMT